jgi:hypothetical protein
LNKKKNEKKKKVRCGLVDAGKKKKKTSGTENAKLKKGKFKMGLVHGIMGSRLMMNQVSK